MAYVKQHAVVTGQPALSAQINENFEDSRRYVNTGIIQADLSNNSVNFPEIVRGEFDPYTGDHQFTCGHGFGIFVGTGNRGINPLTNQTKREYLPYWGDQGAGAATPGTNHPISQTLTLPDTFKQVIIEQRALITYRALIYVKFNQSNIPDADDNTVTPEHRYTTYMYLTNNGGSTVASTSTKGRFYDEGVMSNTWGGGPSSWAGPPDQDPMRDLGAGDGYDNNINGIFYRRKYQISKTWIVSAGTYAIGVMYDCHNENGYTRETNVSIEVEYIGSNIT